MPFGSSGAELSALWLFRSGAERPRSRSPCLRSEASERYRHPHQYSLSAQGWNGAWVNLLPVGLPFSGKPHNMMACLKE